MANESPTPIRDEPEDVTGATLESIADVRRELARLYRLLKKGYIASKSGGVMVIALGTLAKTFDGPSIRDFTDEEIRDEVLRRRTERQAANAEQ